jgi:hypothetical protein
MSGFALKRPQQLTHEFQDINEDNLEKYRLFEQNLEYVQYQNIKPKAKNIDLRYTCILHILQLEYIETIAFASLLFLCAQRRKRRYKTAVY